MYPDQEPLAQIVSQERNLWLDQAVRLSFADPLSGALLIDGLECAYQIADGTTVYLDESAVNITIRPFEGPNSSGDEILVENESDRNGLHVQWILRLATHRPVLLLRTIATNRSENPVALKMIWPVTIRQKGCGLWLNPVDEVRCLQCRPHSWRATELYYLDGTCSSELVTAVANGQGQGMVCGFATFEKHLGQLAVLEPTTAREPIVVHAFHHFEPGIILERHQVLSTEWVYLDCNTDVLQSLEAWAEYTGRRNRAVFAAPKPTAGYTWYYYREAVSEEIVLDAARFLAANQDRFPVNYFQLDYGWQKELSCGETEPTENFPHGLEWLAREIEKLGLVPGIWINPFMVDCPTAPIFKERPDLFQKDSQGEPKRFEEPIRNIMGRLIANMHTAIRPGNRYHLDATLPETRQYLRDKYRWVRGMGFRMVMLDFLDAGLPGEDAVVADRSMTDIEVVRAGLEAVRDGLGIDGMILASGAYYLPAIGVANIVRTAGDIPAHWKYVSRGCRQQLLQYFLHNRLFTAYADAMVLRDKPSPYWDMEPNLSEFYLKLSLDEAQFYTAVTGLSGIAVWIAEDVSSLPPERQWLLSLILPIYDRGRFRPVDLFKNYNPRTLKLELFEGGRDWILAAGLNWQNLSRPVALRFKELDLDPALAYHAFDVFNQRYSGTMKSEDHIGPVNPRGVRLINLVRVVERPQVIGTDLHITQGAVEIAGEEWNGSTGKLTLSLNGLQGRKGHLWVWAPSALVGMDEDGLEWKPTQEGSGQIARVAVTLDRDKTITLSFAKPATWKNDRRAG
jgi:hypothetical protein